MLSDRQANRGFFLGHSNQYGMVVFVCFLLGTILQALNARYEFGSNGLEQFSRACLLKKDMLPFLLILFLFWLMYSVVFVTVIYRPGGKEDPHSPMSLLTNILRRNFFQMFGEFDSEENLQKVSES
ncbi:unnamed protein product [Dibothriocephalus latus]|uniref:Uncharacterized protein n=1 Tax=Dibothriocephalus latus TaxID=60516 RepID=A0A3P7PDH8_DIBLA|nr:unnamed protein product [Dibothriocephalus latus]